MHGEDENTSSPTCEMADTTRRVAGNSSCINVFLCKQDSLEYIELSQLCDGKEDCGEEKSVCTASRLTPKLFVSPISIGDHLHIFYCLPGLKNMEQLSYPCVEDEFFSPEYPTFGVVQPPRFEIPNTTINCDHVYGELYVYLSCMGRCINSNCGLMPLMHDSCPSISNRTITLAKNKYLTFVILNQKRNEYHNRFFRCQNKNCVNYEKVCNLVNDCGDHSDEMNCTGSFQCKKSKLYIPRVYKCDGKSDCKDYSDECNEECNNEIIDGVSFKALAWVIAGGAIFLNAVSLWETIFDSNNGRKSAFINRTFKVVISFGDLITGIYLLVIVLVDSMVMRGDYCKRQISWLTSDVCAIIGVLSTFGAELSLFSMTFLSMFRRFSVGLRGLECTKHIKLKVACIISTILAVSLTIACIPLSEKFDDFFVNGIAYKDIQLFIGVGNKKNHLDVLRAYYGKISKQKLSWKNIKNLLDLMFTDNYGQISRRKIHFYGNEGVCLFKYFVTRRDPQRIFVWMMLLINFTCFVTISVCYTFITAGASRSQRDIKRMMARVKGERKNNGIDRLQKKVALIIASDFICWIPFLSVCVLHSLELIDATFLYTISSIVILPINSFINPIIYNNFANIWIDNLKQLISRKRYTEGGTNLETQGKTSTAVIHIDKINHSE